MIRRQGAGATGETRERKGCWENGNKLQQFFVFLRPTRREKVAILVTTG
jgi:hypothetical protein